MSLDIMYEFDFSLYGQTYGWLELTMTDQMIDSYLFGTTVVKTPS